MSGLRFGSVSFINALPLTRGLRGVVTDVPSRLAERFGRGELDVALLPSVEAVRRGGTVVPGFAIASEGPVDSVLLFHRGPLAGVRRILLDTSSRTSAALCRLLFGTGPGRGVKFADCGPATDPRECGEDAVLLIGDPALRAPRDGLQVVDLASAWRDRTGLPFVFAVWAARTAEAAAAAAEVLAQAKERGRREVGEIAREAAEASGIPEETLRVYLTRRIGYDLGEREQAGLERYLADLKREGLL